MRAVFLFRSFGMSECALVSCVCGLGVAGFVQFGVIRPCTSDSYWVLTGSSSLSGCALGVAGFVLVRLVRPVALWKSLGLIGFVCCVRERCWGRWVLSVSFGLFG